MTSRPRFTRATLVGWVFTLALAGCSGGGSSPPPATPDTTAPTVSSTNPASGSTGVPTGATLRATFSEAVDPATANATTFTLTDSGGRPVAGTVTRSGSTVTFTPASALGYLTTYTATLTTGIKDLSGNALAANDDWSFTTETTPTPLISAATLKGWVDDGAVNRAGDDKVVILDVGSASYATAHIPGAQAVNGSTDLYQNRQEGPAVDVNMVLDGAHMDALVQRSGIDANTTVVFTTTPGSILGVTRAYWTFRYWGFPKEKLKVLDGLNTAWTGAGYPTSTDAPSVTASSYGVGSNAALRPDLRASLTEMMAVARDDDPSTVILDARNPTAAGASSYAGDPGMTEGVFKKTELGTDFVVFEGHMRGAVALDYRTMYDGATFTFKPATDLATLLGTVGIDATKTTYVHCRTGVIASLPFFVLDAILGWDAVNYDGSWSQWGQLSADAANGGVLPAGSPWATDVPSLSELVVYNHPTTAVEILTLDGAACSGSLSTAGAATYSPAGCASAATVPEAGLALVDGDQIEAADATYMATH